MDLPDAFKKEVDSLIDLAPPILSPLSAKNQYSDLFYENTSSVALLGGATASRLYSAPPLEERDRSLKGYGIHSFTPTYQEYHAVNGAPSRSGLENCLRQFTSASSTSYPHLKLNPPPSLPDFLYANEVSLHEKKRLVREVIETAFSYEPDLGAATVEYQDRIQQKCMINTTGNVAVTNRAMIGLRLKVMLSRNGRQVEGISTHFSDLKRGMFLFSDASYLIKRAINQAISLSSAQPIPSGSLPVIFEGSPTPLLNCPRGNASIWLHETIGHLLEADQYISHACAPIDGRLTSVPISLSDNPSFMSQSQGADFDDEGSAGRHTDLVVDGYLKHVLTDAYRAFVLRVQNTGNGRRQDYRFSPLPRMTTLYLHPGKDDREALISSVKQGIYVKTLSQGHTYADTQHLELRVKEGFYIEHGKLTHPITNVTIKGKGIDILDKVIGIGADLPQQPLTIQCKKNQQVVPVSVASPTVLIKQMDVYQHR